MLVVLCFCLSVYVALVCLWLKHINMPCLHPHVPLTVIRSDRKSDLVVTNDKCCIINIQYVSITDHNSIMCSLLKCVIIIWSISNMWLWRADALLLSSRYTLFYSSEKTGMPVMKPLWVDFPADKSTFKLEDEHLVGLLLIQLSSTVNSAVS